MRGINNYEECTDCFMCHSLYDKNNMFYYIESGSIKRMKHSKYICLHCATRIDNIRCLRDWTDNSTCSLKKCYRCHTMKSIRRFNKSKLLCSYCKLKMKWRYIVREKSRDKN